MTSNRLYVLYIILLFVIGAISLYTIVALSQAMDECRKCDYCIQEMEAMKEKGIQEFNFTFPPQP